MVSGIPICDLEKTLHTIRKKRQPFSFWLTAFFCFSVRCPIYCRTRRDIRDGTSSGDLLWTLHRLWDNSAEEVDPNLGTHTIINFHSDLLTFVNFRLNSWGNSWILPSLNSWPFVPAGKTALSVSAVPVPSKVCFCQGRPVSLCTYRRYSSCNFCRKLTNI